MGVTAAIAAVVSAGTAVYGADQQYKAKSQADDQRIAAEKKQAAIDAETKAKSLSVDQQADAQKLRNYTAARIRGTVASSAGMPAVGGVTPGASTTPDVATGGGKQIIGM